MALFFFAAIPWDYLYSNKREMNTFYLPLTFRPTVSILKKMRHLAPHYFATSRLKVCLYEWSAIWMYNCRLA